MRFSIFTFGARPMGPHDREFAEMLEQAEAAEELGFSGVWLAEHHGSNWGIIPNPAVLASAIAQRTKRLRIGIAVSILPYQHPMRIAEDWAMVDSISGGRLDFAAGRGYQPREFRLMGADPETSREVFAESLDVILGLWNSTEPFTYRGKYFQLEDAELFPRPVQDPIPVWVAALSKSTFGLVANKGLQVISAPGLVPMEEMKRAMIEAARTLIAAGRAPESIDFPMLQNTIIAPTTEEAFALAEEPVTWHYNELQGIAPGTKAEAAPKSYEAYNTSMDAIESAPTVQGLVDDGVIFVGDPAAARARIAELRDSIGLKHYLCTFRLGGMKHEDVLKQMELWAKEVIPAFPEETPVPEAFLTDTPATS